MYADKETDSMKAAIDEVNPSSRNSNLPIMKARHHAPNDSKAIRAKLVEEQEEEKQQRQ